VTTVNTHFTTLKTIATGGFLAASECTEFVFGQSSAPTPLRELTGTDPPDRDPLAGLRGTLLLSGREKGGEGGEVELPGLVVGVAM